jgi:hypothetical protein
MASESFLLKDFCELDGFFANQFSIHAEEESKSQASSSEIRNLLSLSSEHLEDVARRTQRHFAAGHKAFGTQLLNDNRMRALVYNDAVSARRQELRKRNSVGAVKKVTEPYVMAVKPSFSQVSSFVLSLEFMCNVSFQAKVLQRKNNRLNRGPSTWNSFDAAHLDEKYPEEDLKGRAAPEESGKRTVVHVTSYRFTSNPKLTANIKGQWNFGLSKGKYRIIADTVDIGERDINFF